jgi:tRNA-2-methylthio-N6-dimethylallyladenosine synthase
VEKGARRGDMLQARTRDFKTVMIPADGVDIGGYYTVELTGTTGSTFTGTLVAAAQPRRMALPMAAAPALV